jgi:ABC-type Fe3+-hydroxamate transport system substrate-binding protein
VTVENPELKNVLIYERREICINSIIKTMMTLGVNYNLVSKEQEFYEEILSMKYSHILVSSVLYKNAKKNYKKLESDAKFFLIAEFPHLQLLIIKGIF